MITLTKAQFIALDPCHPEKRLALWGDAESLNVEQALDRGYTIYDILWVAGEIGLKHQCVIFAIRCARLLLHLNPDPRVRTAIDAAQAWLDKPCPATADAADVAADAAYVAYASNVAANVAYAADAAAYAAYASNAAANAAAHAAADTAADTAADAAAYSARAVRAAARTADVAAIKAILIDVFSQQSVD